MNAPESDRHVRRALRGIEDFPHRTTEIIRFGDLDANNHVNNAVFSTFFEAARVTLFRDPTRNLMPDGLIWTLAQITIDYLDEMHWPGTVEIGIGLASLGRTSAVFEQAIFFEGRCTATAKAINVLVDLKTRRPAPITDEIRSNYRRWMFAAT
ncbi:thioesterase family protein [Bradyrhizobium sp. LHD-71]|uniref:acyl-CoA thioesterase n=1 Tax=Bradyrhizobium sp. LHD-71 TaxID=3072141 RepID=UPI0028109B5A|nr:thioesterase family protein [Bradyrhizobium sp. LHD-71]MDQ8728523.1 thioesterase family protein [Bradyrhizobium sp. LHD-71]